MGKKHQPFYRVVAIDSRCKRGGREIEVLGTYNPRAKGKPATAGKPAAGKSAWASKLGEVVLDRDRVKYWLNCGAQVTDTMASLLKAQGLLPPRLARHAGVRN
jgi:small subunit ribosomal protein S16